MLQEKRKCRQNIKHKIDWKGDWMDNKNEMIETNQSLDTLIANSIDLIQYARQLVAKQVNLVQLMTYYSLGKWIVEVQQEGQERAQYGKKVIKALSNHLTEKFGRGFSKANLEFFRRCICSQPR